MMRYLLLVLKIALFLLVIAFALKNTDVVTVRYYVGAQWHAPLVLVLLVFFALGAALGIAASLAQIVRQRREIVALKRELRGHEPAQAIAVRPPVGHDAAGI